MLDYQTSLPFLKLSLKMQAAVQLVQFSMKSKEWINMLRKEGAFGLQSTGVNDKKALNEQTLKCTPYLSTEHQSQEINRFNQQPKSDGNSDLSVNESEYVDKKDSTADEGGEPLSQPLHNTSRLSLRDFDESEPSIPQVEPTQASGGVLLQYEPPNAQHRSQSQSDYGTGKVDLDSVCNTDANVNNEQIGVGDLNMDSQFGDKNGSIYASGINLKAGINKQSENCIPAARLQMCIENNDISEPECNPLLTSEGISLLDTDTSGSQCNNSLMKSDGKGNKGVSSIKSNTASFSEDVLYRRNNLATPGKYTTIDYILMMKFMIRCNIWHLMFMKLPLK